METLVTSLLIITVCVLCVGFLYCLYLLEKEKTAARLAGQARARKRDAELMAKFKASIKEPNRDEQ
jgi:hypothetical protein